EDQSAMGARAAEQAARDSRQAKTAAAVSPGLLVAAGVPGRDPYARPRRVGEAPPATPAYEVTSVVVLPAEEEPLETIDGRPPDAAEGDGDPNAAAPTVSDWLPGIRDEH